MISSGTLDRILDNLDKEDRVPNEGGYYTVSNTIYGCSSLSRGGSYYDWANNFELTKMINEGKLPGVYERSDWPAVFSIIFNPEKMTEESAERLISFLEDVNMNARTSVPCINEDIANELEMNDVIDALVWAVRDIADNEDSILPESLQVDNRFIDILLRFNQGMEELYTIETGPSVYVDTDTLQRVIEMMCRQARHIEHGDTVWWNDPENGICSKLATVIDEKTDGKPTALDELTLKDHSGGITGAYRSECERVKEGKARYIPHEWNTHYGEIVSILALCDPYRTHSAEYGLKYSIAFPDGTEGIAYGDELL